MADAWVVDSVVGFLCSPQWTTPINNFLEANCLEFAPDEENKLSYTRIHKEYQELVESVLEGFLSELGLSAEQFATVMEEAETSDRPRFTPGVFATVAAAEDFLLFKSLMVNKNVELELETRAFFIQAHQHAQAQAPEQEEETRSQRPTTASSLHRSRAVLSEAGHARFDDTQSMEATAQEETLLQKALRLSLEEYNKQQSAEDEELQRVLELSAEEHRQLMAQAERDQDHLNTALQHSLAEKQATEAAKPSLASQPLPPISSPSSAVTAPRDMPSGIDSLFSSLTMDGADAATAAHRKRIASQRQRIVAKRMAEREHQLKQYTSQQVPQSRPSRTMSVPKPSTLPSSRPQRVSSALASRIRREVRK
ncbi:hypothetical protein PTSG_01793 [Salpingoeca rosetta]|uniref:Cilia- and flagella-associated protein 36 n=1 Tax=Salpingoeca rosetta (strain ATCC 50818 / BSB-021) TaxID=946362 RepID=F2TYZ4_SALR5|nr:uncharacterized protein PTSG_01793 [Salpingoeca rosetta]EGD78818.1 hypothetical protein PTSG_01793 [Salpingoeca rosetta]|eukprot:XP_004997774.1 hypothetical protein PTSG_01793 [Salpingoeca rosetta]